MNTAEIKTISNKTGLLALSPVLVFLVIYVAVSAMIGDFYKMPISVALTAASMWSIVIMRKHSLIKRLEIFSRAAGQFNILYMIWVFVLAGAFATLANELGAVDATVNLTLKYFPADFVVPTIFFAACFISFSIGTSVGTVVALTPLAVEMATAGGNDVAFYVAVVLGGAFFCDNLSFISDTTIASTRSQECDMSDKFKANITIALPAALATLALYIFKSHGTPEIVITDDVNLWLVVPYLIVIATAVIGINVTVVLTLGIGSTLSVGLCNGHDPLQLAGFMGEGINSMGNLIIITLLATGMLGIIKAAGGIVYLLQVMTKKITGTRGAQAILTLLVGLVNLCTANNTVAIITVGDIAREISDKYGIDRRKTASLLDSASCVVQCLIPYGAQTLLATSLAGISPAAPFPYLYYPWSLAIMIVISIIFLFPHRVRITTSGTQQEP